MKNKTKVVVALGSLLAVTSGIGAYSTFAWFTTTRTATVNVTSAKVYSNYGKLLVSYADTQPAQGVAYTTTSGDVTDGVTPVTGISSSINNATDISGSGKVGEFYKPTWVPGTEGTGASAIPNAVNGLKIGTTTPATTDSYYIAYNLKFWNKGTVAINVYFNSTTLLVAHQSLTERPGEAGAAQTAYDTQLAKDVAARKSTRVAVYEGTTEKSVWQQDADTHSPAAYNYITNTTNDSDVLYTQKDFKLAVASDSTNWHQGDFTAVTKGFTAGAGQTLCTIAAGESTVLTFTSWIEGTLNEADNDAIGGVVDFNMNFAALEAA